MTLSLARSGRSNQPTRTRYCVIQAGCCPRMETIDRHQYRCRERSSRAGHSQSNRSHSRKHIRPIVYGRHIRSAMMMPTATMTGPVISSHRAPSLAASALAAGDATAIPNGRGRSAAPACVAVYPRSWMSLSLFGSLASASRFYPNQLYAALSGLLDVPFLILIARLSLGALRETGIGLLSPHEHEQSAVRLHAST